MVARCPPVVSRTSPASANTLKECMAAKKGSSEATGRWRANSADRNMLLITVVLLCSERALWCFCSRHNTEWQSCGCYRVTEIAYIAVLHCETAGVAEAELQLWLYKSGVQQAGGAGSLFQGCCLPEWLGLWHAE